MVAVRTAQLWFGSKLSFWDLLCWFTVRQKIKFNVSDTRQSPSGCCETGPCPRPQPSEKFNKSQLFKVDVTWKSRNIILLFQRSLSQLDHHFKISVYLFAVDRTWVFGFDSVAQAEASDTTWDALECSLWLSSDMSEECVIFAGTTQRSTMSQGSPNGPADFSMATEWSPSWEAALALVLTGDWRQPCWEKKVSNAFATVMTWLRGKLGYRPNPKETVFCSLCGDQEGDEHFQHVLCSSPLEMLTAIANSSISNSCDPCNCAPLLLCVTRKKIFLGKGMMWQCTWSV